MVDQHAVEERGRRLGLQPKPTSVVLGPSVAREWKRTTIDRLSLGDVIADMGVVSAIEVRADSVSFEVGVPSQPYVWPSDYEVFAFTNKRS